VPEIFNGTVEIKSIAREAGYRSKVAVAARQEGVDPVGCCVGLRGIRIQNIVNELNGEKIDVVAWNADAAVFIANALSPAQIVSVELDQGEEIATVIVPDRQLSLAIGKEGQNVRLAAKLTGWKIDIKSVTAAEAERAEAAKAEAEAAAESEVEAEEKAEIEVVAEVEAEIPAEGEKVAEPALAQAEVGEVLPALDSSLSPSPSPELPTAESLEVRFAEDLVASGPPKPQAKAKKKKRKAPQPGEGEEEDLKVRKARRGREVSLEDEDEY
jgi:N utilization substance protein A